MWLLVVILTLMLEVEVPGWIHIALIVFDLILARGVNDLLKLKQRKKKRDNTKVFP